jgi:hypothetical protein
MKRSDILVGEDYAVVARRTNDATPVRGVVIAVGLERKTGSGLYSRETKKDGVRVRFDEPMVSTYSSFRKPGDGYNPGKAVSETVLPPNCFLWPWAEEVEYQKQRAASRLANQQEADELGDAYEPTFEQANAVLKSLLDNPPKWDTTERQGTERKRTISARK